MLTAQYAHALLEKPTPAAQTHAEPFYARHGFTPCGDVFMEAGIPHRTMERLLRWPGP